MIIIFIPAKGYSERVKLKNSRKIDGSSLVERALEFAKKINLVSKIVLSTESVEIISDTFSDPAIVSNFVSEQEDRLIPAGNDVFIHKRPSKFSTRTSKTTPLLIHFLETHKITDGHLLLLQPTSPFRLERDASYFNKLNLSKVDSLFSISKIDSPHPAKAFQLNSDGSPNFTEEKIQQMQSPAQTLGDFFAPDGAFYLIKIAELLKNRSLISKNSICYERFGYSTINIDSESDFKFAMYVSENGLYEQ